MKRLLADIVLILILVSLGSYINQKDNLFEQQNFSSKIEAFEDGIAQHQVVTPSVESKNSLADIKENKASRFAQTGSEWIVNAIHGTVGMLSEVFDGMLQ